MNIGQLHTHTQRLHAYVWIWTKSFTAFNSVRQEKKTVFTRKGQKILMKEQMLENVAQVFVCTPIRKMV